MQNLFRLSFCRFVLPCVTAALVLLATRIARADYIVTVEQVGSNVVATGSGSIDLTGLSLYFSDTLSETGIDPSEGLIVTGPASGAFEDLYTGFTGPTSIGSGGLTSPPSTGSGNIVGIVGNAALDGVPLVGVPSGYVSGSALSDTSTYDNATLASLGVTPGTYTWTWDSGANSFTLDVEKPAAAPEPSSLSLLGIVLLAGLWLVRKQMFAHSARA
jgi:hypothetical protein